MAHPKTDEVMQAINDLGVSTPEYHEALWFLFSILARKHSNMAHDSYRDRARRERAAATRASRRS